MVIGRYRGKTYFNNSEARQRRNVAIALDVAIAVDVATGHTTATARDAFSPAFDKRVSS
jgi:hypothetical protein